MSIMHLKANALSDSFESFTMLFGKLLMTRRIRQERDQTAAVYTDLIENADDHKLYDLGYTRHELYQMRDDLYR